MPIPKVLVVAGSDSSGGAGLEADQRTLAAHGVYAMTATTALTAQNTLGVHDIHVTPPAFVARQIACVLDDMGDVDVVKLGMLASADTIAAVHGSLLAAAATTTAPRPRLLVLDPVTVSTSGAELLPRDAVRTLRTLLLPSAYMLTPNIPEAVLLLRDAGSLDDGDDEPSCLDDLKALAKRVHALGRPRHVLLKGGHMPLLKGSMAKAASGAADADKVVVDILYGREADDDDDDTEDCFHVYEQAFLASPNTHGTGCSLASAIAANLATHLSTTTTSSSSSIPIQSLVGRAIDYVTEAIRSSAALGLGQHGAGPIHHLCLTQPALFARGQFVRYLRGHADVRPAWQAYTRHAFPRALARGTLPADAFRAYLVQDYHFLRHFARAHALGGYKAGTLAGTVREATTVARHIRRELDLHLDYCAAVWGLTPAAMDAVPESPACVAYSRYVLDVGQASDLLALHVALAPCLLGYADVAGRIHAEHVAAGPASPYRDAAQGNACWRWVENYVAADYADAVAAGTQLLEDMVDELGFRSSAGKLAELVRIFRTATEMEVRFWDEYPCSTTSTPSIT